MTAREVAATIQVGETVGYVRYGSHGLSESGFDTVAKKNGHGHVHLSKGLVFGKDGHQRDTISRHFALHLMDAGALMAVQKEIKEQRELNYRMQGLADLVADTLRNHRNGFGHYSALSPEDKEKLIAAVRAV